MLGLLRETDPAWATNAVSGLDRLLPDHAHCEMKAASNALALSARCFEEPRVMRALVEVAEEELAHFKQVLGLLEARGVRLGTPEEDWYAAELRRRSSASRARHDSVAIVVTDRLIVGALIEARSCERFKLLREALQPTDAALAAFYGELLASEARHYRTFLDLAVIMSGAASYVDERHAAIAHLEAVVVAELRNEPTIHG